MLGCTTRHRHVLASFTRITEVSQLTSDGSFNDKLVFLSSAKLIAFDHVL